MDEAFETDALGLADLCGYNAICPFFRLFKNPLPESLIPAWERSEARRGEAKIVGGFAHAPDLWHWYVDRFYGEMFYAGRVPVKYKELGRLRLSQLHGCASCNRGNRLDAKDNGLTDDQIRHIANAGHPCFDPADKAVLALADLLSLRGISNTLPGGEPQRLDADTYAALKLHFTDGHILELSLALSMLAGVAHFLFAFDLVEKEDYCEF